MEYCYPSGLEKTLSKWDIHVPLVTKGLKSGKGEVVAHAQCIHSLLLRPACIF